MLTPDTNFTFLNWDRSIRCQPRRFYQPTTEEEVIEIVREASRAGDTLRVFGAGHSWSPLVLTDDTLLNLDHLNGLIAIDTARMQVTVQAGIRIKQMNEILPQYGLAMVNLGSIAEQSIAGAVSTATHGTGIRYGSLSTQIIRMNLVTGDGRLLKISADEHPELMSAARVSLGALGVITQVTLQCVKAFNLHLHAEARPFADVLKNIDTLIQGNDRVRFYWFPGTEDIYVMTMNHTDEPVTPSQPVIERFRRIVLRHDVMALLLRVGHGLPDWIDAINRFEAQIGFVKEDQNARSDRILNIPMPPRHQETEYAVPVEKAAEAVWLTRKIIDENNYKASVPVEIRFVAADENMLSPSYGRMTCYVGAYTFGDDFAKPYFEGFERTMKNVGGRPHWGKRLTLTANQAREMYPLYDRFNAIRKELDPSGTFANEFIRKLFE